MNANKRDNHDSTTVSSISHHSIILDKGTLEGSEKEIPIAPQWQLLPSSYSSSNLCYYCTLPLINFNQCLSLTVSSSLLSITIAQLERFDDTVELLGKIEFKRDGSLFIDGANILREIPLFQDGMNISINSHPSTKSQPQTLEIRFSSECTPFKVTKLWSIQPSIIVACTPAHGYMSVLSSKTSSYSNSPALILQEQDCTAYDLLYTTQSNSHYYSLQPPFHSSLILSSFASPPSNDESDSQLHIGLPSSSPTCSLSQDSSITVNQDSFVSHHNELFLQADSILNT